METSNGKLISRRTVLKAGAAVTAALALGIWPGKTVKAGAVLGSPKNPNQLGFMYDQTKCIGCRSCQKACQQTNHWDEGVRWRRVLQAEKSKAFLSISCNHCENPACVSVCPVSAYTKRERDGVVVHDPEKCIGCKYCLYACPYQAPEFSESTGRTSKCTFCYERKDVGEQPACIKACPTKALTYGRLSELRQALDGVAQIPGLPSPDITKPSLVIIRKV